MHAYTFSFSFMTFSNMCENGPCPVFDYKP